MMNYLKNSNIKIKPVDADLLNLINLANRSNLIDIFKSNILEIGIGIGHKSINLAKLFDNYYGIEQLNDIYQICKENLLNHKSDVTLLNMDLKTFVNLTKNTDLKFNLVILTNSIHFIGLDNLFQLIKKIIGSPGYIIIINPIARPYGWGDKELCEDSDKFNKQKWIKHRDKLKSIYNDLDNSPFLLKKTKNDFNYYYLLKL